MKLLIDTNIYIPMEPTSLADLSANTPEAARLAQLASATRCQLWVHPAQRVDIAQDTQPERRAIREQLFAKYQELAISVPRVPATSTNDWVDEQLILAVERNAVDVLITEDRNLTRKATARSGADRVVSLRDAISMLEALLAVPVRPPPAVESLLAFELDASDPIWESFRQQYPQFDTWLAKCQREHRQAWVIQGDSMALAGVAIVNHETQEPQGVKTLKLCSFKIAEEYSGKRYGELLLKAIFSFALANGYDSMFVTVFPDHEGLIVLLEDFGFKSLGSRPNGELGFSKKLSMGVVQVQTLDPLGYHVDNGPGTMDVLGSTCLIVPIKPVYHRMLFPELQQQRALLPGREAYGNSIKKAYLCGSNIREIGPGSSLLFYRSVDERSVRVVGVAEESIRSQNVDEICAFVLPRTVYTKGAIEAMCRAGPVRALMFRQCMMPFDEIGYRELVAGGALNGPPQSITRVNDERKPWLAQRLGMPS